MRDLIIKRLCLGTPEPHDLQEKSSEETVPTEKLFAQSSEEQRVCMLIIRAKPLDFFHFLLQLQRKSELLSHGTMSLLCITSKTNYCGYWINWTVAHNWFEKIKCHLLWDLWKSIQSKAYKVWYNILIYAPGTIQATPEEHLLPWSDLCLVRKGLLWDL